MYRLTCEGCSYVLYSENKKIPNCPICRGRMFQEEIEVGEEDLEKEKCKVCDYEFFYSKKPFKCPMCDNTFEGASYY
ncbi:MAG: hypothetical protein ACE5HW_03305 [Candidatus Methanofastidiosia archaeon]